jgi:hypothetical protein
MRQRTLESVKTPLLQSTDDLRGDIQTDDFPSAGGHPLQERPAATPEVQKPTRR